MNCSIEKKYLGPTLWYANKIFRQLCQGLFVEEPGIKQIKRLMNNGEKVILIPQYKSFADHFVMTYVLQSYGIPMPFTVGNQEDTPRIKAIDALLKGIGYIHARRSRDQSMQESYITQALIRELLQQQQMIVMFQNGKRMRSGRLL